MTATTAAPHSLANHSVAPHSLAPRTGRARPLSSLRAMLLAVALVLVVAACGSGTVESAAGIDDTTLFAAVPAVPTTAPILLPPEDAALPALAPLPTSAPVVVGLDSATAIATVVPSADESAPGTIEPADSIDATEPTAATAPVVSEPAATTPVVPVPVVIASVDAWSPCVVSAAQSVGASALLDPIASATVTDLTSVQLNALAAAAAPCGIVADALTVTDLGAHLGSATSCMNEWLASSGGGSVFTGLAAITFDQATPAWAQPHLTSSIQSCFSGASFAAQVMANVASDPTLSAAFDAGCLASSFESSGTLAGFAQRLAADPANATLSITMSDGWVLSCANVGRVVAAAAAADGVALSAPTVACLDAELSSSGLAAQLLAGTADSDAVGIATIGCLTNDEAAALLN